MSYWTYVKRELKDWEQYIASLAIIITCLAMRPFIGFSITFMLLGIIALHFIFTFGKAFSKYFRDINRED